MICNDRVQFYESFLYFQNIKLYDNIVSFNPLPNLPPRGQERWIGVDLYPLTQCFLPCVPCSELSALFPVPYSPCHVLCAMCHVPCASLPITDHRIPITLYSSRSLCLPRSGLSLSVLSTDCSCLHFSISPVFPERSISGTFQPRNSAGLV